MPEYFCEFQIVGEVADMLLMKGPTERLLVDISTDAPGHEDAAFRKYPNRTTLTFEGAEMIADFLASCQIGDVVETSGGITQSEYVPYKTTYIDTVLKVSNFRKLQKSRMNVASINSAKVLKSSSVFH